VPATILWSGVGVILSSPIALATRGYLFARDQAGTIAWALIVSAAVWFGISAALIPEIGAPAVGIGWVFAGILNSAALWRRTARLSGAVILPRLAAPLAVALAATAAAWLLAHEVDDRMLGAVVGFAVGEAAVLVGLLAFSRRTLDETLALVRQSLRSLRAD